MEKEKEVKPKKTTKTTVKENAEEKKSAKTKAVTTTETKKVPAKKTAPKAEKKVEKVEKTEKTEEKTKVTKPKEVEKKKSSKAEEEEKSTSKGKKTEKKVESKSEDKITTENIETQAPVEVETPTKTSKTKKENKTETKTNSKKETKNTTSKTKPIKEEKQEEIIEDKEIAKVDTKEVKESKGKKVSSKKEEKPSYDIVEVEGYHHISLYTYVYDNVENPKAVVVIVHGMQEHAGRYEDFAKFLNANGYIVIANDLRGHGHNCSVNSRGFGERDIYQESVKDEIILIQKAKETYKLPIYLVGHSYGSMLSQTIIQDCDLVEKCVLSGTANGSSSIMQAGSGMAGFLSLFKSPNSKGGMIEKMCVKSYGKKFENGNWLSRDEENFKRYQEDEYCGGSFPFGFYKSMLRNMAKANNGIDRIGKKRIYLLSGDKDPVGSNGKQVKSLCKLYLENNIDAKYKLYPEARHEILNETNKKEVYNDILDFFEE